MLLSDCKVVLVYAIRPMSAEVRCFEALDSAAKRYEETREPMWREWAAESGAYMNEANPFNKVFAKDYYGANYEQLQNMKIKYNPHESLFVLAGVGSDAWDYDLDTGKLCRVKNSTATAE